MCNHIPSFQFFHPQNFGQLTYLRHQTSPAQIPPQQLATRLAVSRTHSGEELRQGEHAAFEIRRTGGATGINSRLRRAQATGRNSLFRSSI